MNFVASGDRWIVGMISANSFEKRYRNDRPQWLSIKPEKEEAGGHAVGEQNSAVDPQLIYIVLVWIFLTRRVKQNFSSLCLWAVGLLSSLLASEVRPNWTRGIPCLRRYHEIISTPHTPFQLYGHILRCYRSASLIH